MKTRLILPQIAFCFFAVVNFAAVSGLAQDNAPPAIDVSGTWVFDTHTPVVRVEGYLDLRMDAKGNLTGEQHLFQVEPIVAGSVHGNHIDYETETWRAGKPIRVHGSAEIVGDTLRVTPPRIAPPSDPTKKPPPSTGFRFGPLDAKRGTPPKTYRAPVIDYRTLPKVALPALAAVPYNGLAKTPPMGWNSWNKFQTHISDKIVREIADAMVSSGMRDAGYEYINIDDGWEDRRDAAGVIHPNPNFPDMKALADYVHSRGLKLGIYSSPGPTTCGGFVGSYGHEQTDANTWAKWGIDYLKYDWCSAGRIWDDSAMQPAYQLMGNALAHSGRPIVYSLCQYGRANVETWGPSVSGNLWRTTGDIGDRYDRMANIGFAQSHLAPFAGPGHWNDPDMLEVGNGGMTAAEYRTHFSLWAMQAAPLLAGNDLRDLSPETKEILLNKEVIVVDQDSLGKAGYQAAVKSNSEIWVRPLSGSRSAIAIFNRDTSSAAITVLWADLKLTGQGTLRDLWGHKDLGKHSDGYTAQVEPHGVVLLLLK